MIEENSGFATIPKFSQLATCGDYDNDGDLDAFFLGWWGSRNLVENNGDGTFTDVTTAAGLVDQAEMGYSANWVDFNNDGYLDLFISDGTLYQNNGDKTFRDVAAEKGIASFDHVAGSAWADYDNDGDADLMMQVRQYRNDNGVFVDVTEVTGVLSFGIGLVWGDYNNDEFLDLYMTRDNHAPATLYKNNGDGTFSDVTTSAGVLVEDARGVAWGDIDNDGDLDLFVTRPPAMDDPYLLFRNNGDGTFTDIHHPANIIIGDLSSSIDRGQGASWADFNNDGKLDLFVANSGYPDFLFKNHGNGTGNHFLVLTLVGTNSNRSGIGARVTVEAGGFSQIREVEGGANTSQNSLPVEFGLDQTQQVDKITIRWPSGLEESTTRSIAVDQFLTLEEGTLHTVGVAEAPDSEIPKEFALSQNYPNPFNPLTTLKCQLPKAEHVTLTIYNIRGQKVRTLVNEVKQPGSYKIEWNGKNSFRLEVGTGLYVVRMKAGEFTESKKILLMK